MKIKILSMKFSCICIYMGRIHVCFSVVHFHISVCPVGSFGRNCRERCECGQFACDSLTGECQCPPGFRGVRCATGERRLRPPSAEPSGSDILNKLSSCVQQSRIKKRYYIVRVFPESDFQFEVWLMDVEL